MSYGNYGATAQQATHNAIAHYERMAKAELEKAKKAEKARLKYRADYHRDRARNFQAQADALRASLKAGRYLPARPKVYLTPVRSINQPVSPAAMSPMQPALPNMTSNVPMDATAVTQADVSDSSGEFDSGAEVVVDDVPWYQTTTAKVVGALVVGGLALAAFRKRSS